MGIDTDKKLRTLSLFSGIGGIEIGLRHYCRTVCYIELDSYAQAVLCKNMAAYNIDIAPIWSDVTTFGREEVELLGDIECITAGFPCQDLSCAGHRKGIKGERSALFFEVVRLIRLVRPRIVFLENVPGLLIRGMDRVLGELSESGYNARWQVLSAADVGAHHRRDRVWVLGWPVEHTDPASLFLETEQERQHEGAEDHGGLREELAHAVSDTAGAAHGEGDRRGIGGREVEDVLQGCQVGRDPGDSSQTVPDPQSIGLQGLGASGLEESQAYEGQAVSVRRGERPRETGWPAEPNVGRMVNGVPHRVDRLKCLGNAVVPRCAEKAFEILTKRR